MELATPRASITTRLSAGWLDRQTVFGYILLTPALVLILIFLGYPFVYGLWLSLTNLQVGAGAARFIGFENFTYLLTDPIYQRALLNTFLYAVATVFPKFILGLVMAAVLNVTFHFNRFVRAAVLLPYIMPTVFSTLAWLWMYDPTYSVINWALLHWFGVHGPVFLAQQPWPIISVCIVNIWRGAPFFGILILAGMQTVPRDLLEAATVDGAGAFRRWLFVTVPLVRPVIMIVTLLSFIGSFGDFQVIWLLTGGGPVNSTQILGTLAYSFGIPGTSLGLGAATSLSMFPLLCIIVGVVLWLLRRP